MHKAIRLLFSGVVLSLLGLAAGPGCSSVGGPGSASFASVIIQNHTADEVAAATIKVFQADGYQGGRTPGGELVFEREASRATSFAREGIVSAHYGATTINRVRAEIISLGSGTLRLQCKAFMVTGGGDQFFQDEVPLANFRSGPYRTLLRKVADELK